MLTHYALYGKGIKKIGRFTRRELLPDLFTPILKEKRAFRLLMRIYTIEKKSKIVKKPSLWIGCKLGKSIWKVNYVNPAEVQYQIKGGIVPLIQDGEWDRKKIPFKLHDFVVEHYQNGIPVKETSQYRRMYNGVIAKDWGKSYWCRSLEEVERHFEKLVHALDEIKNGGYKSHIELRKSGNEKGYYPNEVLLSIDREGKFMHESGGSHRLSMAKICEYEKIPAIIIRVHENQKERVLSVIDE